jgi:hypothetical protein
MDKNLQKQMAINEKLKKLLEETQKKILSIMILSLEKIVNLGSIILYFKKSSRHYQWRKKMQIYGGM